MTTYPKHLTSGDLKKLKGMKLIYTGSSEGPLSGRVKKVIKLDSDRNNSMAIMDLELDWKTGTTIHDNLTFNKLRFINKDEIRSDSYPDMFFYPNGYPRSSCNLCRAKCKATTPCSLYDSILRKV